MKKTDKAADELYLTFKAQYVWGDNYNDKTEITPLAFANAYEPSKKGWESKKLTQFTWAYGGGWNTDTWEEREDGIYVHSFEWKKRLDGGNERVIKETTRVADNLQPRIIKNIPMCGFKISRSVSRTKTSNKLWRIEDPRGFELEISTSNMEDILSEGTVIKNEIHGTLRWVGKQLKYV